MDPKPEQSAYDPMEEHWGSCARAPASLQEYILQGYEDENRKDKPYRHHAETQPGHHVSDLS
jgi:hypothetical protein